LRSQHLANAANSVALALDGEERSASDRARIDTPAAPFEFAERRCWHEGCMRAE
jgi:hypothetical protein